MERKSDDAAIGAFFGELSKEPWLGWQRRAWPRHCYHLTDAQNAASILRDGRLFSRERVNALGFLRNENASIEVISQTQEQFAQLVRLYFRPRTATFARNEGLRPSVDRYDGAHCPVPVAFIFDIAAVAGRFDSIFSDGNLASRETCTGNTYSFLRELEFQEIYHDAPLKEHEHHLKRVHQAEIAVPNELTLDALRRIVVRSEADRLTLLTMLWDEDAQLPPGIRSVEIDQKVFFCRWSYLLRVVLNGECVVAHFDSSVKEPGVFTFRWRWRSPGGSETFEETEKHEAKGVIVKSLPANLQGERVRLDLYLDDALAFTGILRQTPSMTLLR